MRHIECGIPLQAVAITKVGDAVELIFILRPLTLILRRSRT